jgi:acetylornithine deacetylase/succinyl-diaminopimelate desuccinylase-like protein
VLVPIAMPGFTDSHWFREAFNSALAYGFCPQRALSLPEAAPLPHGPDERAAVADVELATRFFYDIAREVLE